MRTFDRLNIHAFIQSNVDFEKQKKNQVISLSRGDFAANKIYQSVSIVQSNIQVDDF